MNWRSRRTWPPLIGGSSVQTAIVMAMAAYGGLTLRELCALLKLPRPHLNKRLLELRKKKILISFRWGGNAHLRGGGSPPPCGRINELLWAIDPRHPLLCRLLRLGRLLAIDFPLPGPAPVKARRALVQLPRSPKLSLSNHDLQVLGDKPPARIIMLLARNRKVQIYALRHILGLSKATMEPTNALVQCGVLKVEQIGSKRRPCVVSLGKGLCASGHVRSLARTIDDLTGHEYFSLTAARQDAVRRKTFGRINSERSARRIRGKAYFLKPTGFAVTGYHNRWTPPKKTKRA